MFHPTIGQCAHQSLSNIATPELGMIPQGVEKTSRITRSQRYTTQPSQHGLVYQAKGPQQDIAKPTELGLSGYQEMETLAAKLVGSLKR